MTEPKELVSASEAIEKVIKSFIDKTSPLVPELKDYFDSIEDKSYIEIANLVNLFFPNENDDTIKASINTILAMRQSTVQITDEQFNQLNPIIKKHLSILRKIMQ